MCGHKMMIIFGHSISALFVQCVAVFGHNMVYMISFWVLYSDLIYLKVDTKLK